MNIHNIRLGHATNSSSSHSIIYAPGVDARDTGASGWSADDFGWNAFVLASQEAKDAYMAAMLKANFLSYADGFTDDLTSLILRGLGLEDTEATIDHQSLHILPKEYGSNVPSLQFFKEFLAYIRDDGVLILGGNDNDESSTGYEGCGKPLDTGRYHTETPGWVCRKDGDWWTLYHPGTGDRTTFSFFPNPAPYKPATPLLVDLKVTDFCTHGCAFCYQGSTKSGEHMLRKDMWMLVRDLKLAQVFEVAIGGGEPTQFPGFLDLLHVLKEAGITANFTTKSTDWLENGPLASKIIDYIGAFAYSADEVAPLKRIVDIFVYNKWPRRKLNVQLVPAALDEYTLKRILEFCSANHLRVTLLGFKETGRGAEYKAKREKLTFKKFDETLWLKVISELSEKGKVPRLAIDTTLAARYEDQLREVGIPEYLYHVEEGKYSAYIDAVAWKFGPSSYHLDKLIEYPQDYSEDKLRDLFSKIEAV